MRAQIAVQVHMSLAPSGGFLARAGGADHSHDGSARVTAPRPKRIKDDRISSKGCESNNGILAKLVKHHRIYKWTL